MKPTLLSAVLYFSILISVQGRLAKPALLNNLDGLADGLEKYLISPNFTVEQWPTGLIAKGCLERAKADGLDSTKIKTYSVTYSDVSIQHQKGCSLGANINKSAALRGFYVATTKATQH